MTSTPKKPAAPKPRAKAQPRPQDEARIGDLKAHTEVDLTIVLRGELASGKSTLRRMLEHSIPAVVASATGSIRINRQFLEEGDPMTPSGLRMMLGDQIVSTLSPRPVPRRRHPSNIGTAAQVIEWTINHSPDGPAEQDAFLRQWSEGDVGEWPDYLIWLDQQEEDVGSPGALLDPGVGSIAAQERLEVLTNGQRHDTSCGTGFLADERALRFVERFGWPKDGDMLEWLTATTRAAGSGANLAALKNARTMFGDDDMPF